LAPIATPLANLYYTSIHRKKRVKETPWMLTVIANAQAEFERADLK